MQELSFRNDILPLKDKLFRLALRITFDRAEAEDVVQETLIRVWNKRDEWSQFGSIEAYCLTVARNLAIDRSERKDSRTVELTPEMEQASDASGPYEKLVNKERMALIHRLMNKLPEKQRLIMQLRDVEGKSYKEIAAVLNLTEEQVKVNLFRARQKVRYWQCETSLEDEAELRAFFSGSDVPKHLLRYKDLFVYQQLQQEVHLGEDFDARVLAEVEVPVVKAKRLTLAARFMPLFKAAAVVAVVLSLGNVMQHSFFSDVEEVAATDTIGKQISAPSVALSGLLKQLEAVKFQFSQNLIKTN